MNSDSQIWSEDVLLTRLKAGDRGGFNIIYHQYVSKLYLYAYNILRDRDMCRDIVQEVLIQLWVRRDVVEIRSLNNYLFTAVRFKVLKAINLNGRKAVLEEGEMERIAGVVPPVNNLDKKEINRLLEKGINTLPEKCREVFVLSRKEYLSNKEISQRLNIATKTVENHMTIALHRLRVILGDFLI
jgi:RNA polymerase sigma-70 factor (family 1)